MALFFRLDWTVELEMSTFCDRVLWLDGLLFTTLAEIQSGRKGRTGFLGDFVCLETADLVAGEEEGSELAKDCKKQSCWLMLVVQVSY